jgi:hypothetical protein
MRLRPSTSPSRDRPARRWLCAALFGLVLFGAPNRSDAEPTETTVSAPPISPSDTASARVFHREGLSRFRAGDYAGAIEHFGKAYELTRVPGLLYNIAQAERLLGHCGEAVVAYRAFLAVAPGGPARSLAEARLAELEPCPPAATAPAESRLEPGSARGGQELRGTEPSVQPPSPAVQARTATRPAPPAPRRGKGSPGGSPTRSPTNDSMAPWTTMSFGSAAVLLSLSGYFAWRSGRSAGRVSSQFEKGGTWNQGAVEEQRSGQRDETLALVGLVGGILATGVGVWTITFD